MSAAVVMYEEGRKNETCLPYPEDTEPHTGVAQY